MAKTGKGGAGNPAFMRPWKITDDLEAVVGQNPIPRPHIVRELWKYIKKHGLQDGRNITADKKLKKIFGGEDSVTMFELQKHISANIIKPKK